MRIIRVIAVTVAILFFIVIQTIFFNHLFENQDISRLCSLIGGFFTGFFIVGPAYEWAWRG